MVTVQEYLSSHGDREPLMVPPTMSVLDAAREMDEAGVGSVLVGENGILAGIFTERDLMRRVVAKDRLPGSTPVGDVMTTALVTASPAVTLASCGGLMSERRIRHLPVVEGEKVVGVITTGDLLANELAEKAATIQQLEGFVFYTRS